MANQRASSLPELGRLNTPGEVAVSTIPLKQRRRNHTGSQWLGPSGWCTWFIFKDDGGNTARLCRVQYWHSPYNQKGTSAIFLKNREPQTDIFHTEIQNAVPGVGSRQWQRMGQLTRHGLAHGKTIGFLYRESSAQANYSRNRHSNRNLLCQLLLCAAF
jgi:hypothetical protein